MFTLAKVATSRGAPPRAPLGRATPAQLHSVAWPSGLLVPPLSVRKPKAVGGEILADGARTARRLARLAQAGYPAAPAGVPCCPGS